MKPKIGALFILVAALIDLSGCGYIKTLFPDKEKDYQYTTEIPPLVLPNDLKTSHIPGLTALAKVPPPSADATEVTTTPFSSSTDRNTSTTPATEAEVTAPMPVSETESEAEIPDTAIKVERIKFNEGENRLRINVSSARAWRLVGKALSRKAIEVTERNQEAKLFTVQYDPDEQKAKEASFLDEVEFVLRGSKGNEKTYLLKLDGKNEQTDITVVDNDQKLLSDAGSVKLLTLVEETIKADLAKK